MADDLDRRLRRLDDMPAPDLWSRVGVGRERPPLRVSPARRAAVAVAALAIASAAFVFLATSFRPDALDEPVGPLSLPDDPCALVTTDQVAAATGSAVLSAGVVPDERLFSPTDPNPCAYETDGRFGQVIVMTHDREGYVDIRDRNPQFTQPVQGVGDEAFVQGGSSLWVLVGDSAFSIGAQHGAGDAAVSMLETLAWDALANMSAPPSQLETPTAGLSTYTDPRGWKVDYPTGWIVTPFEDSSSGRLTVAGAAISSLPMSQEQPGGYPGVSSDGSFEGGVAVVIAHREGGPAPDPFRDDSSFPLDPSAAQMMPGGMALSGVLSFRGDGVDYEATFGGQHPSEDDLRALRDVIRRIRFPALAGGQSSGGWLSLGPSEDFKEGTGTPSWSGDRLGVVYVMRGPGGTYALDLEPDSCGEGENETWDRQRLQVLLECPDGTEVRFERYGTPVPGNPSGFTTTLDIHPVITAWNGSLLIDVDTRVGGIVDTYWP